MWFPHPRREDTLCSHLGTSRSRQEDLPVSSHHHQSVSDKRNQLIHCGTRNLDVTGGTLIRFSTGDLLFRTHSISTILVYPSAHFFLPKQKVILHSWIAFQKRDADFASLIIMDANHKTRINPRRASTTEGTSYATKHQMLETANTIRRDTQKRNMMVESGV